MNLFYNIFGLLMYLVLRDDVSLDLLMLFILVYSLDLEGNLRFNVRRLLFFIRNRNLFVSVEGYSYFLVSSVYEFGVRGVEDIILIS